MTHKITLKNRIRLFIFNEIKKSAILLNAGLTRPFRRISISTDNQESNGKSQDVNANPMNMLSNCILQLSKSKSQDDDVYLTCKS